MAKKQLKDYPQISLLPDDIKGKIDFPDIFGREKPVHIEIGCGRGTFLVNQAINYPDINFLAVEWANKYYRYAVDRLGRKKIGNVRLIRTEAANFLAEYIADNCVECFHIYFPDPWPKKRHNKRRFVCEKNICQIIRCLKKGGIINIATDHVDYFEQMKKAFEKFTDKLKQVEFIKPAGALENELVGTNYERKYIKEQRNIFTIAFKKI